MTEPRDELERIGNNYRQKLPEKLRDLIFLFNEIDPVLWSRDSVAPLVAKLHALRGSAETFGYTEIAAAAGEIEQQLRLLASRPYGPSQFRWWNIGESIRRLGAKDLSRQKPFSSGAASGRQSGNRPHIPLVDLIEDDRQEADQIIEVLQYAGFRVRHFTSGLAYKENWNHEEFPLPNAIIVDMVLASGDLAGAETVDAIKPDGAISPVIFLSRRDDMAARLKAFEVGATRYLVKPVDSLHLINLLDALTSRQPEDPYRVLLVDDEPSLLEAQAEMLGMVGMSVMTVSNPMETLDALKSFRPDVLILDVYMPGVTGPEIAAIIRDSDDYLNLPILFLSIEDNLSQQLMALSLGGDDFLVKPVRQDQLVSAVSARARRARQNSIVFQQLKDVNHRLRMLTRATDELCIRIVLDENFAAVAVNKRFEELTRRNIGNVGSLELDRLGLLFPPEEKLDGIFKTVDYQGVWQGHMALETSGGELELETAICASPSREASGNAEYLLLGTVIS